jgi:hypothetical protein
MNKIKDFQQLVKEIHRVNKGWHCFETSNRFLNVSNTVLQSHYLQKKNILQEHLMSEYRDLIEIRPEDLTGYPSIKIKEKYQFDNYFDACHLKKVKEENNV